MSDKRLEAFGQAAVRAVSAIDAARPRDQDAFADAPSGIVTLRNVLPDWAIRLVIATLLLPALLAGLDAFFRVRRRRLPLAEALRRVLAGAVPVLVAWGWLRLLGVTGLLAATDGAVLPGAYPLDTAALVAVGSAALIAALGWYLARRLIARPAPPESHAIAAALAICGLTSAVWLVNPYAAALLLPAMHLWLFAGGGWSGRAGFAAIVGGLALPILAVVYLGAALALSPVDLAWASTLTVAGGHGFWTALVLAGLFAALGALIRALLARRGGVRAEVDGGGGEFKTRGPLTYAGPGSLGGTESALRR